MNLNWSTSGSASCFYAAAALVRGETLEPDLFEALAEPTAGLGRQLCEDSLVPHEFFGHLIPLSAKLAGNQQLAESTMTKLVGRDAAAMRALPYRGLLGDLERAFDVFVPNLAEQLAAPMGRLRQAVEARAAAVFGMLAAWIEPAALADEAAVLALYPAVGGAGAAHLRYNSIGIEAVSHDPEPTLPEWTRALWLLALLNLDLPRYRDHLRPRSSRRTEHLAMIPPVLDALHECEPATKAADLVLAVQTWMESPGEAAELAETLTDWWQAYRHRRPPWPTALAALEQLLDHVPVA